MNIDINAQRKCGEWGRTIIIKLTEQKLIKFTNWLTKSKLQANYNFWEKMSVLYT
jgi:hypothetical protein